MASYKGHLKGGIATGIGLLLFAESLGLSPLSFTGILELSISCLVGSLLPDIDHPNSILGRRLPFISKPIHKYFGHRGLTHSICFLCITLFLPTAFNYPFIGVGLCVGTLSHIILDFICVGSGVALFYPMYKPRIYLFHKNKFRKGRKHRK